MPYSPYGLFGILPTLGHHLQGRMRSPAFGQVWPRYASYQARILRGGSLPLRIATAHSCKFLSLAQGISAGLSRLSLHSPCARSLSEHYFGAPSLLPAVSIGLLPFGIQTRLSCILKQAVKP